MLARKNSITAPANMALALADLNRGTLLTLELLAGPEGRFHPECSSEPCAWAAS